MSLLLRPGPPLVIGHRGAAAVMPENTLLAFAHAIALGVDAVEFDVHVTADGVAVVHHDPTTGRTCGDDLPIATSHAADLRPLDAGATFAVAGARRGTTAIPLLDEVLELTRGTPIIIECKTVASAPVVLQALHRHGAASRALVGSFLDGAMQCVRADGVASGASRRDMIRLLIRSAVRRAPGALPYGAMCVPEAASGVRLPLGRFAAWGRSLGVPVHVWTVNAVEDAVRLWAAGVTGIITDDPATILAARAALRTGAQR